MKFRDLDRKLKDIGYSPIRQSGSHILYGNNSGDIVNVPYHIKDEYQKKGWVLKLFKKHGVDKI